MANKSFAKLKKDISNVKDHAVGMGQGAFGAAGSLKEACVQGIASTVRTASAVKAGGEKMMIGASEKLAQGIHVASAGLGVFAKGVHFAAKAAEKLANGLDHSSDKVSKVGKKISRKK